MNGTNGMKTKKIGKMNELAWVIGIVVCSLGVCLCKKSDFGLSMIAAPPFILHVALKDIFPWFTHGTAEYVWQGFLLILMCAAVQRFPPQAVAAQGKSDVGSGKAPARLERLLIGAVVVAENHRVAVPPRDDARVEDEGRRVRHVRRGQHGIARIAPHTGEGFQNFAHNSLRMRIVCFVLL